MWTEGQRLVVGLRSFPGGMERRISTTGQKDWEDGTWGEETKKTTKPCLFPKKPEVPLHDICQRDNSGGGVFALSSLRGAEKAREA